MDRRILQIPPIHHSGCKQRKHQAPSPFNHLSWTWVDDKNKEWTPFHSQRLLLKSGWEGATQRAPCLPQKTFQFALIVKLELAWQPVMREGGGSSATKEVCQTHPDKLLRLGYTLTHSSFDGLSLRHSFHGEIKGCLNKSIARRQIQ